MRWIDKYINRKVGHFSLNKKDPVNYIAVWRKSIDILRRTGRDVVAEFSNLGDRPSFIETLPISRIVLDEYTSGEVDEVYVAYTRFFIYHVTIPCY